jgi:hypothetical protein
MRRMYGSADSFSLLSFEASSEVARSALDVLTGMSENGGERVEKIQAPTTRMWYSDCERWARNWERGMAKLWR